jgi:hypothetical protein
VLVVAGSTTYRLTADGSGFRNLTLVGDWRLNGLTTPGGIASAVMSGRQAARAVSGGTDPLLGESDIARPPERMRTLAIIVLDTVTFQALLARRLVSDAVHLRLFITRDAVEGVVRNALRTHDRPYESPRASAEDHGATVFRGLW